MSLYSHPFSARYWRDAAAEVRSPRKLTFAALMIALCVVLGYVPSVPLAQGVRVTWGFLARALCALVCGPVLGMVFGLAEDLLSFFLTGGGGYPFFPGYTLTTVLGVLLYALLFYRARLTVGRIFLAKLLTHITCAKIRSVFYEFEFYHNESISSVSTNDSLYCSAASVLWSTITFGSISCPVPISI